MNVRRLLPKLCMNTNVYLSRGVSFGSRYPIGFSIITHELIVQLNTGKNTACIKIGVIKYTIAQTTKVKTLLYGSKYSVMVQFIEKATKRNAATIGPKR